MSAEKLAIKNPSLNEISYHFDLFEIKFAVFENSQSCLSCPHFKNHSADEYDPGYAECLAEESSCPVVRDALATASTIVNPQSTADKGMLIEFLIDLFHPDFADYPNRDKTEAINSISLNLEPLKMAAALLPITKTRLNDFLLRKISNQEI